jgi:hypothetical protein
MSEEGRRESKNQVSGRVNHETITNFSENRPFFSLPGGKDQPSSDQNTNRVLSVKKKPVQTDTYIKGLFPKSQLHFIPVMK